MSEIFCSYFVQIDLSCNRVLCLHQSSKMQATQTLGGVDPDGREPYACSTHYPRSTAHPQLSKELLLLFICGKLLKRPIRKIVSSQACQEAFVHISLRFSDAWLGLRAIN